MSLLIDEVTAVESTAEKVGLDAGKIAAQKLGSMMRKYHNKLGVDRTGNYQEKEDMLERYPGTDMI